MPKVTSTTQTVIADHDSLLVKSHANNAALYPNNGADTNSLIPAEGRGFTEATGRSRHGGCVTIGSACYSWEG